MNRRLAGAGIGVLLTTLTLAPPLRGQELSYEGSLHYSTGEYLFTERTNSAYLFSGVRVAWDRVTLSADVPVIWQSTPWISYTSGVPVPSGGPQQGEVGDTLRRRRGGDGSVDDGTGGGSGDGGSGSGGHGSGPGGAAIGVAAETAEIPLQDTVTYDEVGIGDPTMRLAVVVLTETGNHPSVTLTGTVKPPLADPDAGFGTGEWDGGATLGLSKRLGEYFLFADVGYWVYGDMPELELADPVTYSAGVGLVPEGGKLGLMASVSGSSRILEGADPPVELGAGMNLSRGGRRSLSATVSFGLTETSPDVAAAMGWSIGL